MPYYMARIEVLVMVSDESEACDAIAESLRPMLQEFQRGSSLIDWRYADAGGYPALHDGSGFEYAQESS